MNKSTFFSGQQYFATQDNMIFILFLITIVQDYLTVISVLC